MLIRTIARAAAVAGLILSGAAACAQADPKPADTDALRRGVAQGAAFCKAHLASAPPDLKLGEVEEFCTCMGVHEFAMSEMTNEAKASLRPRQQQMCVEIVRKQGQAPVSAPGPAATPATPSASPPAAPATAEQPARNAPAAAALPPPVERFDQWTLNTNITGAPVAYARATDSDIVVAFMMYCRAKDSIGLRVRFKGGAHEKDIGLNMGGDVVEFTPDKNGVVSQKSWADFLKFWLENEKHFTPARRKEPDYSGVLGIFTPKREIGGINLDGLGDARKRLLQMCADAITKGAPEGNYITTGLAAFDAEVLVGSAPNGTPSSVVVVAPHASSEPAQPVARRPGTLPFEGEWRQSTNDTCQGSQTITRKAVVERPSGSVDTFKVLGLKQLSDTAYNLTVRVHDVAGHGTSTRNRVLRLDMKGEDAMTGTGPYYDGRTVEFLRCPDRAPSGAAAVAPKPKAVTNCSAAFERNYAALRRKELDLAGQTGAVMQSTPRFFWNFCPIVRQEIAAAQQIIAAANACPSHPRAVGIRSEATAKLAKRQRELARPNCV